MMRGHHRSIRPAIAQCQNPCQSGRCDSALAAGKHVTGVLGQRPKPRECAYPRPQPPAIRERLKKAVSLPSKSRSQNRQTHVWPELKHALSCRRRGNKAWDRGLQRTAAISRPAADFFPFRLNPIPRHIPIVKRADRVHLPAYIRQHAMRRTNSPRFEPWHTFVTVFAMIVVIRLTGGLLNFLGRHTDPISTLGLISATGFLLLGLLAMLYLSRELLRQTRMLLQQRREARVRSPRSRLS